MKNEFESEKDLIGVDKGADASVVKLCHSISNIDDVGKGISMPVIELNNDFLLFHRRIK